VLSIIIRDYPLLPMSINLLSMTINYYPLLSIITSYPVYSTIIHYDPLQLLSIIIMTPCRTEKAGFSKKNKKHNQKPNHQKNNSTGRVTRKTKNKKKNKNNKKNKTCIFLRFLSVFSCFSCWRVVVFAFSCYFLDFGFLVCFFCSLWFCFF
jgi:hypothetical protein